MQQIEETQVRSLGWEESLEEGTATHSSILAWRLSRTEGPGGLQSIGLQRVRHDWSDLTHMHSAFWTVVLFLDGVLESPEESSKHTGASLVVQWLRLHLPVKRMRFDLWLATTNPHASGPAREAHILQLLNLWTHAPQQEEPTHGCEKPFHHSLRKSACHNEDSEQQKWKKKKF